MPLQITPIRLIKLSSTVFEEHILPSAVDDVLSFLPPPLDLLQGVGKDAVGVLRMIKRRLQAEMKTIGRNDLKMLSKLLQEDDLEVCSML